MLRQDGELADDERYSTIRSRTEHIDELYAMVEDHLAERPTEEWLELFEAHHIPATRVNTIEDLFADEHLHAVGVWNDLIHPTAGPLTQVALPWSFSRTAAPPVRPAPSLGEHTSEVVAEFVAPSRSTPDT